MDSTSFHVDKEYKNSDLEQLKDRDDDNEQRRAIHITKGYSRDYHPELKQVVLNLIVENSSGIPLMLEVANKNQIDTKGFNKITKEHINSLKESYNERLSIVSDATLEDTIKGNFSFFTFFPLFWILLKNKMPIL